MNAGRNPALDTIERWIDELGEALDGGSDADEARALSIIGTILDLGWGDPSKGETKH